MVKIIQPDGIKYMIQDTFHNESQAREYIDMLIGKSLWYIDEKRKGKKVAPQITIEKLEEQLENIRQYKIVEV